MRICSLALFLALLVPIASSAAENESTSILIANERSSVVTAQSVMLDNCYPNLNLKIEPRMTHAYRCEALPNGGTTRIVVRILNAERKIICEGYWTPTSAKVTMTDFGARCAIADHGKRSYTFSVR